MIGRRLRNLPIILKNVLRRVSIRWQKPSIEGIPQATSFLKTLTSPRMLARVNHLVAANPDWRVLLYLLGPDRLLEYAHAACSSDRQLRSLAPPIAPRRLRTKVAAPEAPIFLWSGAADIEYFLGLFARYGSSLEQPAIFDFGCGCGRLTRFFEHSAAYRMSASDINEEMVDWCRENLRNVDTRVNGSSPPLPFADESFDYGYSLSIFTHLPDHSAPIWLQDVARVTRPGGIFIITTHGEATLKIVENSAEHQTLFAVTADEAASLARRLNDDKFIFLPYTEPGLRIARAGPEYGNCFVHPHHVEQNWCGDKWEMLDYLPGGLRRWQDVFVLKKRV